MKTIIDSPDNPVAQLIFAHGAGAGMHSEFMQSMAQLLSARGIRVIRFDFPYMQKAQQLGRRQPPNRAPVLLTDFAEQVAQAPKDLPLFVGGKSMGGRMATMLTDFTPISGVVCLGYPFHVPGKPEKKRTEHLYSMPKPVCIIQGERDTFGKKKTVQEYQLPSTITLHFVATADHSLVPLKSSGLQASELMQQAADRIQEFIQGQI